MNDLTGATQASLRIRYVPAGRAPADANILAAFEFLQAGNSRPATADSIPVALPWLGGDGSVEVWEVDGAIVCRSWEGIEVRQAADLSLSHLSIDCDAFTCMREATRHAYQQIMGFTAQHEHPCLLKIWHYIPGINQGEGDQEQYRQFCIGRAEALGDDPAARPSMPAATAIGATAANKTLQIYFLSGAHSGLNVENPRQVSAPNYPRQYGPRSPLFSRGTIITDTARRLFLISGTASVVGHETHHRDNISLQLEESLKNVSALLQESRRISLGGSATQPFQGLLKVYLRHAEQLQQAREVIENSAYCDAPVIYLQGDICRSDLLVEVEGIAEL